MDYNELWKEICYNLKDSLSININESVYEQKVIAMLDKIGWSMYRGEIILKEPIRIGATSTYYPDIIVKPIEENLSFIIEVKKPSLSINNQQYQEQLFSYMKFTNIETGMLIGKNIQIFHIVDEKLSRLEVIEFEADNLSFIEIFSKDKLTDKNLKNYISDRLKIIKSQNQAQKIKQFITTKDFSNKVLELMKEELRKTYEDNIVQEVLEDISLSIQINDSDLEPGPINIRTDGVEYIFEPSEEKFQNHLIEHSIGYIKIIYHDKEEIKPWDAQRFTQRSNLRRNINSKTWFRSDYIKEFGVKKGIFSTTPFSA